MSHVKIDEKLDIAKLLENLENYRPKRRGWTWRNCGKRDIGEFTFTQCSDSLHNSIKIVPYND